MDLNTPAGREGRRKAPPQQTNVPSGLVAQEWVSPVVTEVNVPAGAVDWPERSSPQHVTVSSALMAQSCSCPALTDWKTVDGGGLPELVKPQQWTVPSVRIPQL
jgi:hypothetical protein